MINSNLWASVEINYIVEQSKNTEVKTSNNDYDAAHKEGSSHIIKMNSVLVGQLKKGKSRVELPAENGINRYVISVKGREVRLNHSSYNPDGHTWSTPPGNDERQHVDLYEGTHTLDIFISEY